MALRSPSFLCRCCHMCRNSRHQAFSTTALSWSSARSNSYYDLLEVRQDATMKEIKQAFFKKSKQLHPDSNPANPHLHGQFVKLSEAYNVLSKESSRRNYDAQRAAEKAWSAQQGPGGRSAHGRSGHKDPFDSAHFKTRTREPDPNEDLRYWQEFHKPPPEWFSGPEYKRRQHFHQKIVQYCMLMMLGSLLVHYVGYREMKKMHRRLMDEQSLKLAEIYNQAKKRPRSKLREELRQTLAGGVEEPRARSGLLSETLDSVKDPVTPVSAAK